MFSQVIHSYGKVLKDCAMVMRRFAKYCISNVSISFVVQEQGDARSYKVGSGKS